MRLTILSVLLLVGCVQQQQLAPEHTQPGRYADYRMMYQSEIFGVTRDEDYAKCAGDFMVANVAPSDLAELDRYARGEISYSAVDHERIDSEIRERAHGKLGKAALRPYCPDKVDSFED